MRKYTTLPQFSSWKLEDLIAYCQAGDNSNGDWDNVTESEREYLVSVATETFNENQF
jgi:hypothetical protein